MIPQQQEQSGPMTAGLPDKTEYKKRQSSILATMVPQIMNAMGGGDPYVQKALMEQESKYEQKIMQNNLRGFMRSVSMPGTGQITPELIMEQAQVWDVPPDMAMQAITQFQQFRQISRGEKQKYFMSLPEGGVRSIEAYSDDPILQEGAWLRGAVDGMPGPPPVTESYNPDGTATIVPKVPGATINPKPDKKNLVQIDTGDGGKRFVTPTEGMTYQENPKQGDAMTKDQARKEYVRVQGLIQKARSGGGIDEMVYMALTGEKKPPVDATEYITTLERYAEKVRKENGLDFEEKKQEQVQAADYVWDPETMTFKENK